MAAIAAAAAGALASRRITQRSSSSSAPFPRVSKTKITKRSIVPSSSRNDGVLVRVLNEQEAEINDIRVVSLNARVTITCFEKGDVGGNLVLLPRSFEELKKIGVKKYGASFMRVLSEEGAEIDDIRVVRDGDRVNFASQRWRL